MDRMAQGSSGVIEMIINLEGEVIDITLLVLRLCTFCYGQDAVCSSRISQHAVTEEMME
jgi:hypothetical protein